MKADLHVHTTYSDGIVDPVSLVTLAHQRGVTLLSITDHDSIDSYFEAREKALSLGIFLVPGVEINTDYQHSEVHILGYAFNPTHPQLKEALQSQREARVVRLRKMLAKLNELGMNLNEARVWELAGQGSVGRPHLALALMEKKVVKSVGEAFDRYLGYGKPAWVPRHYFTPKEAIELIRAAGGVSVLAHPQRSGREFLKELVSYGLSGLEVYYPSHSSSTIKELSTLAQEYHLFATVGSDYHGINEGEEGPGSTDAPLEVIEELTRKFLSRGYGQDIPPTR